MQIGKLIEVVDVAPWTPAGPRRYRHAHRRRTIVAWRVWCYEHDLLRSIAVNRVWYGPAVWDVEPPPAGTDPAGQPGSPLRGFHAYRWHDMALRTMLAVMTTLKSVDAAVGTCELYGRVCKHEWGYRAQGAVIRKLWIPNAWGKVARRAILERTYACEVRYIPSESPIGATC